MDIPTILSVFQQYWKIIFLVVAVAVVAAVFYGRCLIRQRRKHDALSAHPLNLTEEQDAKVRVRYQHRPYRITFSIPAAFTTDDAVMEWAMLMPPRLGDRFVSGSMRIIPRRFLTPSHYEVTFSRLDDLRENGSEVQSHRYVLGTEIGSHGDVSVPRAAHLAVIGESGSGKGSVIANIVIQEIEAGGEVWFIDLKGGMEAAHYAHVLSRSAYDLDEAEQLLSDFNDGVDARAQQWRGKMRTLGDDEVPHRLLVIDEAADLVKGGALKKQSDHCVELIRSILSRSRALNCTVVVATQNPRVSTSLPYRSLLLTTVALRLNSKSEAVMALGENAVRKGACPWGISYERPGDAYLWDAETNSVRYLHVPFVSDEEIHALRGEGVDGAERSDSGSGVPDAPLSDAGELGATTTPPVEMWDEGDWDE